MHYREEKTHYDEEKLYVELVEDLFGGEKPKYDNLVIFEHQILSGLVKGWCSNRKIFDSEAHEDLMQLIQVRIIKKCEDGFFKPVNGKTVKTCEEFRRWSITVAKNCFRNYYDKLKPKSEKEKKTDGREFVDGGEIDLFAVKSRLQKSFSVVFDLKLSPHIILTWVAVSLIVLTYDISRIKAKDVFIEKFSNMSLFKVFNIVIKLMSRLPWLVVDAEHIKKQYKKLEVIDEETGIKIGDMSYSEFYMKKGPDASVSDWINRVNTQIKKRIDS